MDFPIIELVSFPPKLSEAPLPLELTVTEVVELFCDHVPVLTAAVPLILMIVFATVAVPVVEKVPPLRFIVPEPNPPKSKPRVPMAMPLLKVKVPPLGLRRILAEGPAPATEPSMFTLKVVVVPVAPFILLSPVVGRLKVIVLPPNV